MLRGVKKIKFSCSTAVDATSIKLSYSSAAAVVLQERKLLSGLPELHSGFYVATKQILYRESNQTKKLEVVWGFSSLLKFFNAKIRQLFNLSQRHS